MRIMKMQAYRAWIFIVAALLVGAITTMWSPERAAAAPVLVQSVQGNSSGTAGSASATFPATSTSGDLLVAICGYNASVTLSPPAGFSTAINQSGTVSLAIFYKISAGTETTVSCPVLTTSGSSAIMLQEFSGIRILSPLDAVNTTASTGNSATASSGSVTTTGNDLLVAGMLADSSSTPGSWTSSFTSAINGTVGGKPQYRASYSSGYLSASSTGTFSSTVSIATGNWRGQIAAFKVAPTPLLSTDIVDGSDVSIANPSVTFPVLNRSFSCLTNTGQLSSATQKIRVSNTTTTPGWSLSIAPTSGGGALWNKSGSPAANYDFNDAGGSGCTDSDGDGNGGQLSVVPTSAIITPQPGCAATGINLLGSITAFTGSSAITLASSGASTPFYCYWDITGLSLSQKIPASQTSGTYNLGLTITVVAN